MIDVIVWCIALNVYFEAQGEPLQGQHAVAEVTMTRAEISGRGMCEEVFEDSQFSWTKLIPRPKVTNNQAWGEALAVTNTALASAFNYSNGATHYHAIRWKGKPFPKPRWAYNLCETTRIGNHVFYKPCEVKKTLYETIR